jgi:hypothetical protein
MTAGRNKPFTVEELYSAVESTAPTTPTGPKIVPGPNEIVADPSTAELHGSDIRVDCYANGLDIGYWNNPADWVSWKLHQVPAGNYAVLVRTANPHDAPHDFSVRIANKELIGSAPNTPSWEVYRDVPVGTVHIDQASDIDLEFHPKNQQAWGPTNLSAVKLVKQ